MRLPPMAPRNWLCTPHPNSVLSNVMFMAQGYPRGKYLRHKSWQMLQISLSPRVLNQLRLLIIYQPTADLTYICYSKKYVLNHFLEVGIKGLSLKVRKTFFFFPSTVNVYSQSRGCPSLPWHWGFLNSGQPQLRAIAENNQTLSRMVGILSSRTLHGSSYNTL